MGHFRVRVLQLSRVSRGPSAPAHAVEPLLQGHLCVHVGAPGAGAQCDARVRVALAVDVVAPRRGAAGLVVRVVGACCSPVCKAHALFGNVHLLEGGAALSMLLCGIYFVWPHRALLIVSGATAFVHTNHLLTAFLRSAELAGSVGVALLHHDHDRAVGSLLGARVVAPGLFPGV